MPAAIPNTICLETRKSKMQVQTATVDSRLRGNDGQRFCAKWRWQAACGKCPEKNSGE
ncbi:MAG: hypothetical protein ABSB82_08665 [Terriglobia bacterium]